ncbi:AraC family transcriptional regulator [Rhodococcus triatomae]|nr:AraC-type DNA-binding domain-containing protein [Rhodococcus triatomae BKS 15-14]
MADLICASSLSHAPELIRELGGDPFDVLSRLGIDQAIVGAYDRFVPFSALATLIGTCAEELGVPDFGLRLARRQDPDILGPVAIVARNADTVGAAVRGVAEFAHVYSPALSTQLTVGDTEASYEFTTVLHRLPYRAHVVELALGVTLGTIRALAGPDFRPRRMTFHHQRISEMQVYSDYFECPVEFGADRNLMVMPRGVLDRRLPSVDPLAYDLAVRYMAGRNPEVAFSDEVSVLITRALPAGAATLSAVSELMMLHPRALQRRLAESGRTFESMVDDIRREVALTLLSKRDVPLSAVAQQLGYSEQSALTRSCRRWFAMTPLAKRRLLAEQSGSSASTAFGG